MVFSGEIYENKTSFSLRKQIVSQRKWCNRWLNYYWIRTKIVWLIRRVSLFKISILWSRNWGLRYPIDNRWIMSSFQARGMYVNSTISFWTNLHVPVNLPVYSASINVPLLFNIKIKQLLGTNFCVVASYRRLWYTPDVFAILWVTPQELTVNNSMIINVIFFMALRYNLVG